MSTGSISGNWGLWGPLAERYCQGRPRRVLALDGGGIRGHSGRSCGPARPRRSSFHPRCSHGILLTRPSRSSSSTAARPPTTTLPSSRHSHSSKVSWKAQNRHPRAIPVRATRWSHIVRRTTAEAPRLGPVLRRAPPHQGRDRDLSGVQDARQRSRRGSCSGAGENSAHVRDRVFRQPSRYPVHASYRRYSPRTRVRDRARLIARQWRASTPCCCSPSGASSPASISRRSSHSWGSCSPRPCSSW